MTYYKLEAVQAALRQNGAAGGTIGGIPYTELWQRSVGGTIYRASVKWEHGDQIIPAADARGIVWALFGRPVIDSIEAAGGRWL